MPDDEGETLAVLVDEFFMTEGQVLLRADNPGSRSSAAASFPVDGLTRRLGADRARGVLELQREAAELFDAHPGRAVEFRERIEAASADALPAARRTIADDPFFRDVARRAVEIFFLFYPTREAYTASVHPGVAQHPERFPAERAELDAHYRGMERGKAWLAAR